MLIGYNYVKKKKKIYKGKCETVSSDIQITASNQLFSPQDMTSANEEHAK